MPCRVCIDREVLGVVKLAVVELDKFCVVQLDLYLLEEAIVVQFDAKLL